MVIKITQPTLDLSPNRSGYIRTSATVSDDNSERDIWFEFPTEIAGSLTKWGNPWLLAALPYGLQSNQDIMLDMPVDAVFLENINAWIRKFSAWFPKIPQITIDAPRIWSEENGDRTLSFFSGGVDSWFTLLRHTTETEGYPQVGKVDNTVTIWGFDIPISNKAAFDKVSDACRKSLEPFEVTPIFTATNIREDSDSWWAREWGPITHGLALAATGNFLTPLAKKILIPSGGFSKNTPVQGSHPYTDHLFSSSSTQFIHDHPSYEKLDKLECISRHLDALRTLRVCWKGQNEKNCTNCEKCVRILRSLEVLGVLDEAISFDLSLYQAQRHKYIYSADDQSKDFMHSLYEAARQRGNNEIVSFLRKNMASSRRVNFALDALHSLPGKPLSWRARSFFTRNMIK